MRTILSMLSCTFVYKGIPFIEINTITNKTRCILETYDLQKQRLEKKETAIKSDFYGFTREEILRYLEAFVEEMPTIEKEKGLVSYELVSFSPSEMVLRKNYNPNQLDYEFYSTISL